MPITRPWLIDNLVPLSLTHVLGWNNELGEIPQLVPAQLWPSKNELVRIVDQWRDFRIHKIHFRWVPIARGPPKKVDVGWIASGATPMDTGTRNRIQCFITFPPRFPDTTNGAQNPLDAAKYFDPQIKYWGPIENASLLQSGHPRPVRYYIDKSFQFTLKAKVRKNQIVTGVTSNGIAQWGHEQDIVVATERPFPWLPFINPKMSVDNVDGAPEVALAQLTGNKLAIKQPFISLRNCGTGEWLGETYIPGTWYITTYMYVRGRRKNNGPQVQNVDPQTGAIYMAQQGISNPWTA